MDIGGSFAKMGKIAYWVKHLPRIFFKMSRRLDAWPNEKIKDCLPVEVKHT